MGASMWWTPIPTSRVPARAWWKAPSCSRISSIRSSCRGTGARHTGASNCMRTPRHDSRLSRCRSPENLPALRRRVRLRPSGAKRNLLVRCAAPYHSGSGERRLLLSGVSCENVRSSAATSRDRKKRLMMAEDILEPDLPIVDPHHHLWDRPRGILRNLPPSDHGFMDIINEIPRYLLDELLADLNTGHNIRATVYMECGAMYRADGPEALRCVGETEFVNGVAAMTASGLYGEVRACAGIVGHVDLRLGASVVEDVLRSHIAAGHGRF